MRCPISNCGHRLAFSFYDDVGQRNVYQCQAVRVDTTISLPTARGMNTYQTHTLDHSDKFFVRDGLTLLQVRPVRLSKRDGEAVLRAANFQPYKDDKGKLVFPQAWGVALA